MSFFNTSTSTTLAGANTAADKDIEVSDPPTDSISSLAFSPTADYLAVGSWDNNVGTWLRVHLPGDLRRAVFTY